MEVEEALGPGAGFVVEIPVERLGEHEALRPRQGEGGHVGRKDQEAREALALLNDGELLTCPGRGHLIHEEAPEQTLAFCLHHLLGQRVS